MGYFLLGVVGILLVVAAIYAISVAGPIIGIILGIVLIGVFVFVLLGGSISFVSVSAPFLVGLLLL